MNCSICSEEIKGMVVYRGGHPEVPYQGGNCAEPINDGRCCDECNYKVVIPARLKFHKIDQNKEDGR